DGAQSLPRRSSSERCEQIEQHLLAVEIDRFPPVEQATDLFPVFRPAVRGLPLGEPPRQGGFPRKNLRPAGTADLPCGGSPDQPGQPPAEQFTHELETGTAAVPRQGITEG